MPNQFYSQLLEVYQEYALLRSIGSVMGWDQQTTLPEHGREFRSRQSALLSRRSHEMFTGKEFSRLIKAIEKEDQTDWPAADKRNFDLVRKSWRKATLFDSEFVSEFSRAASLGQAAWQKARHENNFELFYDHLARMTDLCRSRAEKYSRFWNEEGQPRGLYESLVETFEPEVDWQASRQSFAALQSWLTVNLPDLNDAFNGKEQKCLPARVDTRLQKDLCHTIIRQIGFDTSRGVLGEAAHPFCMGIHPDDVRLAGRYYEDNFAQAIYSLVHECGHGLYEQNLPNVEPLLPVNSSVSLGIHESQSRLWENMVARSQACSRYLHETLAPHMSLQGDATALYLEVNHTAPGFIRVDADEYHYNLHIFLRTWLEEDLIEGRIEVKDLPAEWNRRFYDMFKREVPDDQNGLLQDIHWSGGAFGYFPTYTLGNMYAALFYDLFNQSVTGFEHRVEKGDFSELKDWLVKNIHSRGNIKNAAGLSEELAGQSCSEKPLVNYLQNKKESLLNHL